MGTGSWLALTTAIPKCSLYQALASAAEVEATATNILVVATFWMNYASVRGDRDEHESIRQGIVQVMMLLSPLLRDAERVHLNTLTQAYLA